MCKKWRPTVREEFLAINIPLLNGSFLRDFSWLSHGRAQSRAALVALNYECNIAVKRFSATQTSHNA